VSFWFHCHNIVLLFVITLYFSPLLCCTFVRHNIVLPSVIILYFPSWLIFYAKLQGVVYFPKLSIRTFCSYCCVLPVITMLSFRFHRHSIILPSVIFLYFLCYHIVLLSITILYFPLLLYYIFHHDFFYAKLRGVVYFPKLSIYHFSSTSLYIFLSFF
jgi:hypothetical protein